MNPLTTGESPLADDCEESPLEGNWNNVCVRLRLTKSSSAVETAFT